jgi:hypothetical protein
MNSNRDNFDHWMSCHCGTISADDRVELRNIVDDMINEAITATKAAAENQGVAS